MGETYQEDRPIMNDEDREILDEYEDHTAIDDRGDLADYVRAMAKLVVVASRDDSYHMGDVLRAIGVANDLEAGEYGVEEIKDWFGDLSFEEGFEAP